MSQKDPKNRTHLPCRAALKISYLASLDLQVMRGNEIPTTEINKKNRYVVGYFFKTNSRYTGTVGKFLSPPKLLFSH